MLKNENNDFLKILEPQINYNLPYLIINHGIITDRNIILYDKGKIVKIKEIHNYNNSNIEIILDINSDFDDLNAGYECKEMRKIHNRK